MKNVQLILLVLLTNISITLGQTQTILVSNISDDAFIVAGKVQEGPNNENLDYATVSMYHKETGDFITGTVTDGGGLFTLKSTHSNVYLEISFVGFDTKRIDDIRFDGKNAILDTILMGSFAETMDEVIVTATRSTTEFKLDKRVFNVGSDLSSSGASALEVLNNVPSVNVDIEGAVTLRGSSGVQILINGKPSVLADDESGALGTITADMIEKVEVITNPSAKYEAEGSSGIINIILKKNEKSGLNGSASINTGLPANYSAGLSLNKRSKKFNFFTQLGVGYKERDFDVLTTNLDRTNGLSVNSDGIESRNETYYNVILGADYYLNPLNTITLSGNFAYEIEDQPSFTNFSTFFSDEQILSSWTRSESTQATNPKLQYELQYKKQFKDNEEHKILFSAIGNYFGKDQNSLFTEELLEGTTQVNDQTTATNFQEGKYTFNVDYTKPFTDEWTVELGAQYVDNIVSNDYTVSNFIDNAFVIDEGLTNLFEYDQRVIGAYGTTAYEGKVWGVKVGLRVEHTDLETLLTNTDESNTQEFLDVFPSLHTSYKINERISLQAGYSSRIYRPRLWDLNPFFNIRNDFSVRTGNPNLQPEYTDSYEIGGIFIYDQVTFNVNVYQRYTTDKIEYISTFVDNVNFYSPENVGTSRTTGLEINFKYRPSKLITINGDANYNYFKREGTFEDQVFDFSNDQWSSRITTKFKVNKKLDFEVAGNYSSDIQTVQGIRSGNIYADLGIRYKIMDGKGVFNLGVRDVFASRVRESFTFDDTFEAYSFRQLGTIATLGFSYAFGKGDAVSYSGQGRRR